MTQVRAKKHLGQHFLKDENIAYNIVQGLLDAWPTGSILEIGPGTGVLTKYLLEKRPEDTYLSEVDKESIEYLKKTYPITADRFVGDFLRIPIDTAFKQKISIVGNLPYNISSQIFFEVLDHKDQIPVVVCMIQKEVAERIAAKHGNKTYGILSVLFQVYYNIEYLFTVHEHVFQPAPKVKSAVIRFVRNDVAKLECDEKLFKQVVKQSFSTRRKTLRNALKPMSLPAELTSDPVFDLRAEQLSVQDFIALTLKIQHCH